TGSACTGFECYSGGLSDGLQLIFQLQQTCTDGQGTCPPLVDSPLIVSPSVNGADFTFSFQTVAGRSYVVQYKDSLDNPVWQTLQTLMGDGNPKKIASPIAEARQRFYRLRAE